MKVLLAYTICICVLLLCCNVGNGATTANTDTGRILFLYPVATTSETHLFVPLIKSLASKGHQITVVSPVKTENLAKNVHQIVPVAPMKDLDFFTKKNVVDERILTKSPFLYMISSDFSLFTKRCHLVFQHEEFKKILTQEFDLVVMSGMMNECLEGVIWKLKVPYILLSSMPIPHFLQVRTGFYSPPSFVPLAFFPFGSKMDFWERLTNTALVYFVGAILGISSREYEQIYRQYLGEDIPGMDEIQKNLSLIMSNTHFVMNFPRPSLPDTVEIGGIHCREAKPLPKDLDDFISGGKHGTILFSLGSVVSSKTLPDETRKIFANAFSKLKQRVLWKWDEEKMEDLPPNVKLAKWLPQQDILGHPNIKLFISHGGLLSSQESVYHGVPMLGIPLFVDQDANVLQAQELGLALMEELLDMSSESLTNKINRLLNEPSFRENAKKIQGVFRDQQVSPLERATYWVEYVLRHKGAPLLKSPARELSFIEYHSLDVFAVFFSIFGFILTAIVVVCRLLCCRGGKKQSSHSNSVQEKKKK